MTLTNALDLTADNETFSTLVPARFEALTATVGELVDEALAPATHRAYRSDWACFTGWCERNGLDRLPARPETVALYLADLADTKALHTIRRRMVTIGRAHAYAGLESPTRAEIVTSMWKGLRRRLGVAQTRKAPVRTDVVRAMVEGLDPGRLIGVRDRALLVIGFAGALRRSELVSLDVGDLDEVANGLEVHIRRSKTDQEGEGAKLGLPYGSDPLTCPVRAYRAWLDASGIEAGPVFRPVTKGGRLGLRRMDARVVAEVVKRSAERVGLDPAPLAGHSLRSGFITSAAEAGVHERDIMRHSRHQSIPVMRRYIRDASTWKDNAAAKVGL